MKATPIYLSVFLAVFGLFIFTSSASAQVACSSARPVLGHTDFELGPVSAKIGGSPTETVIRGCNCSCRRWFLTAAWMKFRRVRKSRFLLQETEPFQR